MGKKLDKKAKAAVAKAAKGVKAAKVDKAVKKFRKLEGKLWTRDPRARPRPARGKRYSYRGGRGLDQAHLRGRRRVAQGQDGQRLGEL